MFGECSKLPFFIHVLIQITSFNGRELSEAESQQLDLLRRALEKRGFRFGDR